MTVGIFLVLVVIAAIGYLIWQNYKLKQTISTIDADVITILRDSTAIRELLAGIADGQVVISEQIASVANKTEDSSAAVQKKQDDFAEFYTQSMAEQNKTMGLVLSKMNGKMNQMLACFPKIENIPTMDNKEHL